MSDDKTWKFDKKHLDGFTVESIKFFFEQAEEMLKTNIQVTDSLQGRTMRFLGFNIPLSIAILGYIVTHFFLFSHTIPLGIVLLALMYSNFIFLNILKSRKSHRTGSSPDKIISDEWLGFKDEEQTRLIILNECKEYNIRIKNRMSQNDDIGKQFDKGLNAIILAIVIASTVFVMLQSGLFLLSIFC